MSNQLKLACHQLVESAGLEDVSGLPLVTELAGHGLGDVLPRDLHCGRVPRPSLPASFRHDDRLGGHNNITKNCICKIYRLFRLFKIKVQADARWWIIPHMPGPGTARSTPSAFANPFLWRHWSWTNLPNLPDNMPFFKPKTGSSKHKLGLNSEILSFSLK